MADLNSLRDLDDQVSPPAFDSLVAVAGRRDRRVRATALTASLLALVAVGFGLRTVVDERGEIRPADAPTRVPDEVVRTLPAAGVDGVLPPLEAGRYRVPLTGDLAYEVDLPDGALLSTRDPYLELGSDILKVELAGPAFGIPSDPCRDQSLVEPAGRRVDDVLDAVRQRPFYRVTDLGPAGITGATGRHVRISVPAGIDASACPDDQVELPGNPGTTNNMEPGYTGDWWFVETGGRLVVLQHYCATCTQGAPEHVVTTVGQIAFRSTS